MFGVFVIQKVIQSICNLKSICNLITIFYLVTVTITVTNFVLRLLQSRHMFVVTSQPRVYSVFARVPAPLRLFPSVSMCVCVYMYIQHGLLPPHSNIYTPLTV